MLPAPPKSSETRAIMLLILRDSEHVQVWLDYVFAEQVDVKPGGFVCSVACMPANSQRQFDSPLRRKSANFISGDWLGQSPFNSAQSVRYTSRLD
jgi:hypothetical protein